MEKKNLYLLLRFQKALFKETKLIFDDAPGGHEAAGHGEAVPAAEQEVAAQEAVPAAEPKKPDVDKKIVELEGKTSRAGFRKEMAKLPENRQMEPEAFIEMATDPVEKPILDTLQVHQDRMKTKIDANQWKHTSLNELRKAYDDCKRLQILNQNRAFYDTMFAVLRNAADDTTNPHLKRNETGIMFQNPIKYRKDIESLPAEGGKNGFWGGELFLHAHDQFIILRALIVAQDHEQQLTTMKQQKMDVDVIGDKAVGFMQSNLATFKQAVQERDYSTMAVYGIGIYALYKTYQKLGGGEKGKKFKDLLLYSAAGYAAYTLAKNAGYDLLKIAGIKDKDYDVSGTPLEAMKDILASNPSLDEQTKDIDYGVVLRMANVNLLTLDELLDKANKDGIQFINPADLRSIFTKESELWPFNHGQYNDGRKKPKLDYAQEAYVTLGQQIYKIAFGLRGVYDETLRRDHPAYRNKPYSEAIRRTDTDLKNATMWQLLSAVKPYAPEADGGLLSRKRQDLEDSLREVFKEVDGAIIHREIGLGHFLGKIKGFPVVYVTDTAQKGYKIYLINDYNKDGESMNKVPGTHHLPMIMPFEGPARQAAAEAAVEAVNGRMRFLTKALVVGGRKDAEDINKLVDKELVWDGVKWRCNVNFSAARAAEYGIKAASSVATITPRSDGRGIYLESKIGGLKIDLDEEAAKFDATSYILIPQLVDQQEFKALGVLAGAGKLSIDHGGEGDGKFVLKIGDRIKVKMKFDKSTGKFDFETPDQETVMLAEGSGFAEELKAALSNTPELKKVFEEWKNIIEETDEDYFVNFFRHVPDWFTNATWANRARGFSLSHFTGSVPKNYTYALLETQKEFVISKVINSLHGTEKLADVSQKVDTIYSPALNEWRGLLQEFVRLNTRNHNKGENWNKESFNDKIFTGLAEIGVRSNEYKVWYRQFVDDIFTRGGWDDLREGKSIKARDICKVFAHYTSAVDDPEIDGADLKDKENEKTKKFNLHADYVDYVVGQIYLKIETGGLKSKSVVPGPSSFWDVEPFHVWKDKPIKPRYEFVDREPQLKPTDNYIFLDDYLQKPRDEKVKILKDRRGDIILPRKNTDLIRALDVNHPTYHPDDVNVMLAAFGVTSEKELKLMLNGDKTKSPPVQPMNQFEKTSKMRLSQTETLFFNTIQGAFDKLASKYKVKVDNFNRLRNLWSLNPNLGKSTDDKVLKTLEYTYQENQNLAQVVHDLELSWARSGKIVTKSEQVIAIKQKVSSILENVVEKEFDEYFRDPSVKDEIVEWVKNFWAWFW